ncbi:MAG: hypothetical protein D6826_11155 [Alphaproteobacteria bacterium]|nr:MAG: hypothetical protein D6826_11155 [Alphaproteobacteria bacterium]
MHGRRVALGDDDHAGRYAVLVVCADAAAATNALRVAQTRYKRFQALGVRVFAVTPGPAADNFALAARLDLSFPVLCDDEFAIGRALEMAPPASMLRLVVVDPAQRIAAIHDPAADADLGATLEAAWRLCAERLEAAEARIITRQAPVLIVPDVLSRDHCARLIRFWETGDRYTGGVASAAHGANVPVRQTKVREDVALADDGPEAQELFTIFRRRLLPQVRRAFAFRVTHAETLRMGCYTAADGGHFRPHRDDTTPYTAHRRFAASINLNAGEYEGGYLRFPEYGPDLYTVDTGGAIVFSCALLHEATRVTRGRRFVLLGFFYGPAEQALRERLMAERQRAGVPPPAPPHVRR